MVHEYLLFFSSVEKKHKAIQVSMYDAIVRMKGIKCEKELALNSIPVVNNIPSDIHGLIGISTDRPVSVEPNCYIEVTDTSTGGDTPCLVANIVYKSESLDHPPMDIYEKLDKLSHLSRETNGASFNIQHEKSTGLYKVAFSNVMLTCKRQLTPKPFDEAIDDAIAFIETNRVPVEVPVEKFTMFK